LSTSVSDVRRRDRRATFVYLGVTLFCLVFEGIYARMGHGVSSVYMTWLFAWPLVGGVGVFGTLWLVGRRSLPDTAYRAWNAAIATFALGSATHGVFQIAGTASAFQPVYTVAGIVLVAVALGSCIRCANRRSC